MFWVEKVKEKEHFRQNRMLILQNAGNLKQNFSSSAARGNRMEIITFLTISPHDHCMGDSDDHLSTVGTEEQAQCHLKAPSSPHFYYSACLIYFPPSLWLAEFTGISLVIKSLVNKYKTFHQFTQMFYCLTPCLEVAHGADEKNVISIPFDPPGLNSYSLQASVSLKGLECLPCFL